MALISDTIKAEPPLTDIKDVLLERTCLDRGLDPTVEYVPEEHLKPVDLIVASLYRKLAAAPDYSEGRLSVEYPRGTLLKLASELEAKHGISSGSKIKAVKKW